MARNDVYLYTNATSPADAVITAQQDTTAADFPDLVLGDSPTFNFYFTDGSGSWPSFAGNAQYSVEWTLGTAGSDDSVILAHQTTATTLTGGWSMVLPLNTGAILAQLNSARISQAYPVVQLWQQIRVTDPTGYKTTYATIRTNLRLRTSPSGQVLPDDPLPSGYQHVLSDAAGLLVSPANFLALNNITIPSGKTLNAIGNIVVGSGSNIANISGGAGGSLSISPTTSFYCTATVNDAGYEFFNFTATSSDAQTGNRYGLRANYYLNNSSNSAYANGALLGQVMTQGAKDYTNRLSGVYGYGYHAGTGAVSDLRGAFHVVNIGSTGNVTNAYGSYTEINTEVGATGSISNTAYGHYVSSFAANGSGSIGNVVAFCAETQTGGTNSNRAFLARGVTPSSFGGQVMIGTNTLDPLGVGVSGPLLSVAGAASDAGFGIGGNITNDNSTPASLHFGNMSASAEKRGAVIQTRNNGAITTHANMNMEFYTRIAGSLAKRMEIDDDGNLAVAASLVLAGLTVSLGANDSGGSGYRLLRVANA